MRKASQENEFLKLVRAGGIVELYKYPIKATQVMERYPRHCVTRPDFFKFPNIVVKPESTLKPGQVFYIVPYHTIYRLLKSKGYLCHRQYKHEQYESDNNKQPIENIQQTENIDVSFFDQIIPPRSIKNKKQSKRQDANLSAKENRDSNVFKYGDYDSDESLAPGCFPKRKESGGLTEANKDTSSRNFCLKPCLRKNRTNKTRAQQGPRVRFMLPDKDDDNGIPIVLKFETFTLP